MPGSDEDRLDVENVVLDDDQRGAGADDLHAKPVPETDLLSDEAILINRRIRLLGPEVELALRDLQNRQATVILAGLIDIDDGAKIEGVLRRVGLRQRELYLLIRLRKHTLRFGHPGV